MGQKRKRLSDTRFMVLLVSAALLVIISVFAGEFAPNDPYATHVMQMKQPPSAEFPFGTDAMGRCVLSRVLYGARTSISLALILVAATFLLGTAVGVVCGYYGGATDKIIMRVIDGIMAFPQMILAIAVSGILGGGMLNAMIALGFAGWTPYARLARSSVKAIKEEDYIKAARLSGSGHFAIMAKHVLPNIIGSQLTYATVQIGTVMLGFAGLSFLGLGVRLPEAEWGSMISEARGFLATAPWTVLYPGLTFVGTVMVFNFLGDAVRDRLDVRSLSSRTEIEK